MFHLLVTVLHHISIITRRQYIKQVGGMNERKWDSVIASNAPLAPLGSSSVLRAALCKPAVTIKYKTKDNIWTFSLKYVLNISCKRLPFFFYILGFIKLSFWKLFVFSATPLVLVICLFIKCVVRKHTHTRTHTHPDTVDVLHMGSFFYSPALPPLDDAIGFKRRAHKKVQTIKVIEYRTRKHSLFPHNKDRTELFRLFLCFDSFFLF